MVKHFLLYLFVLCCLAACIKEEKVRIRNPKPTLVVEGLLLTDTTPCKVILSYTSRFAFDDTSKTQYINDATVTVADTDGDNAVLQNAGNGEYVSSPGSFRAKVGKSYFVRIQLSNGETYRSVPETIQPVVQGFGIDTVVTGKAIFNNAVRNPLLGGELKIKLQDPPGEKNYYRWTGDGFIPRRATGIQCTIGSPTRCFEFCYQVYNEDRTLRILSDANIDGGEIRLQSAFLSPYFTFGKHFLTIRQLSLTKEAYQFWKLYDEQLKRTGSILDPLPAPVTGNVYNERDTAVVALGYFEASDVFAKKITLFPIFSPYFDPLTQAKGYIKDGICHFVFSNASENAPAGWDNAEEYIFDVKK